MLKLKLQYFGYLMQRVESLEKTLMLGAGGEGDDRGWDGWMASPTQWTWVWVNSRSWWWTGRPGVLRFMGSQRVGHDWTTELNWTEETNSGFKNQLHLKYIFWPHCTACGILVPPPWIEPVPPAKEGWSLNHGTSRDNHLPPIIQVALGKLLNFPKRQFSALTWLLLFSC